MMGEILRWEWNDSQTDYENFRYWLHLTNQERRNFNEPEINSKEGLKLFENMLGVKMNFEETFNE
jgi:hypothetical protein